MDDALLREFHDYYQAIDPRISRGMALPRGQLYVDAQLCDSRELMRSEFYNDFYRRCNSRWMAGCLTRSELGFAAGFAFVRTPEQGPFTGVGLELANQLVPHFANAARIQIRATQQLEGLRIAEDSLDLISLGVVVIGNDGRVQLINRAARQAIARDDGLALNSQELTAMHHASADALRDAIAAAFPGRLTATNRLITTLAIQRPSGRQPFEILIAPLPSESNGWVPVGGGVLLLVTDRDLLANPSAGALAALFGLTPAESRVAESLAMGQSLKECAEAAGYTTEAARWHLKSS